MTRSAIRAHGRSDRTFGRSADPGTPAQGGAIPTFHLYGEPDRHADAQFVHVESLDDRSRPRGWTIRPHAHAELNHIFHLRGGGGTVRADAAARSFEAPCVIVVPAGVVHGFRWLAETRGTVITLCDAYRDDLLRADPALAAMFAGLGVAGMPRAIDRALASATQRLAHELHGRAPGHRAAAQAHVLDIFVRVLRLPGAAGDAAAAPPGTQAALLARFRRRVEERFRLRESIASHAAALGVSESRLRAACAAAARQSPLRILDRRALLEAQRALLFSDLSIAQIARDSGFDDAAYFTRYFTRHVGTSPSAFRRHAATGRAA